MWHKETGPGWGVLGLGGSAMTPCPAPLQAVVLEGNYWKRRIEVVMREYHKWRIYYKKRVSGSAHAVPCTVVVPAVGQDISMPNMELWLTVSGTWQALASMGGGCWLLPWCWCRGAQWGPHRQLPVVLRCAPAAQAGLTVPCPVHDPGLGLATYPQHMCWDGSSRAMAHPQCSSWAGICRPCLTPAPRAARQAGWLWVALGAHSQACWHHDLGCPPHRGSVVQPSPQAICLGLIKARVDTDRLSAGSLALPHTTGPSAMAAAQPQTL